MGKSEAPESEAARPHRRATREWGIVLLALATLEIVVFGGYLTGATIPQFDFMGAYNLEAFAWWTDGSFFDPVQWMPYMYGGYPAVSNLQNSSFYLPVGVMAVFGPFTLHSAAALSALHVSFGALGVYLFARRWNLGFSAALLGLVLWFFVTGFYADAVYVDFQRAYAWIPWVFLVTSVKWDWRRPLATILGAIILWQAVLGIYPGMLVAMGYIIPIWIAANQFAFRPALARYLVPLGLTAIAAVAMALLRFLPALLERGNYPSLSSDTSEFGVASLGTFLFPYTNPLLTWIPSMQALFIPAVTLPLLAFLPVRNVLVRMLLPVVAVAVFLGVPSWPWHDAVSAVFPGMSASRFRFSDFKVALLLCVSVLAMVAFSSLLQRVRRKATTDSVAEPWERTRAWISLALLLALNVGFALIALRYHFAPAPSIVQLTLLLGGSITLWIFANRVVKSVAVVRAFTSAVIIIAVTSGGIAAYSVRSQWAVDRGAAEQTYYGESVDSFVAERQKRDRVSKTETRRPARIPAFGQTVTEQAKMLGTNFSLGHVFYSDEIGVDGYVNLRGTETFELVKQRLGADSYVGFNTIAFWNAAGVLMEGTPDSMPIADSVNACAKFGVCGDHLTVKPITYDSDGRFVYEVNAITDVQVMANEAGYKGWNATICRTGALGDCLGVPVTRGASGQIALSIPAGDWRLDLHYELPGMRLAWAAFVASVLGVLLFTAITVSQRRKRVERGESTRDVPRP